MFSAMALKVSPEALDLVAGTKMGAGGVIAALQAPHAPLSVWIGPMIELARASWMRMVKIMTEPTRIHIRLTRSLASLASAVCRPSKWRSLPGAPGRSGCPAGRAACGSAGFAARSPGWRPAIRRDRFPMSVSHWRAMARRSFSAGLAGTTWFCRASSSAPTFVAVR